MPNLLRFFLTGILAGLLLLAIGLVDTGMINNFIASHVQYPDNLTPTNDLLAPSNDNLSLLSTDATLNVNTTPTLFTDQALAYEPANEDVSTAHKIAYLTFDDGPSEAVTLKILDTAKAYQIKLTFFVLGSKVEKKPEIVQRAVSEGHTIGNHSYSHHYRTIYKSAENLMSEINQCAEILEATIGFRPTIFRAPGGSRPFLSPEFIEQLTTAGYQYYDWNVCPGDSVGKPKPTQTLIDNVLKQAQGKDRIMVLLHDSPNMHNTAEALPAIIEGLQEMGFTFAPITSTTEPIQFGQP
ncbi:MAG: polysaccharide deacetylase [Syntrophomonadaceae bacterium]|nr:polysaccharide deacetylase [Syntrophomonadaceae bacterium]